MCGIAGVVSRRAAVERDRVSAMQQALFHRGPDGAGEHIDAHVMLAMRRLSIIDLGGGWQPLYNEDRSLALVANGEIYNHVELRTELEGRGHQLRTHSDCEVILHLYEERGLDCLDALRGMFAFALWDAPRRRLVLARDRMGEKPLYLYETDDALWFASEMKALMRAKVAPFELDPASINQYFHYQYVPEPRTALKGVRKLPAGHVLVVDTAPWQSVERRYWHMGNAPPLAGHPATLIRERLDEVSELVVRSDVPVGLALSGGLDSSIIAAMVARTYPGKLQAFSIGYPGRPPSDERADAKIMADHLGVPLHEIELDPVEMVDSFPRLGFWRDDPIADIAGHGYFSVMRAAREAGVPVMLQGQGGDELFWGYEWVRQAAIASQEKDARRAKGNASLLDFMKPEAPKGLTPVALKHWLKGAGGLRRSWENYQAHVSAPAERLIMFDLAPDFRLARAEMPGLYGAAMAGIAQDPLADPYAPFTLPQPWPPVGVAMTELISSTYLLENGVAQGDRLGMASSVELRLPLLDHRLVETVIGLRKTSNDMNLSPKAWLREAVRDLLPAQVMNRPKRGFAPPVREWHEALFARHGSLLDDGHLVAAGILDRQAARNLARGPVSPGAVTPISFKALVLECWCREMSAL